MRRQYIRDGLALPDSGQRGLLALPNQQSTALTYLWFVSLQGGLLFRPDHGDNIDGLRGLPCGDVPALGRRRDHVHSLQCWKVRPPDWST